MGKRPSSGRETTDASPEVESALACLRSARVKIPDPSAIRGYLHRFPDMIDLVHRVCDLAGEQFSSDAELALELYRDPEFEDPYLSLYVRSDHYPPRLFEAIEQVRSGYAVELAASRGWLQVTTDFRPPRGRLQPS